MGNPRRYVNNKGNQMGLWKETVAGTEWGGRLEDIWNSYEERWRAVEQTGRRDWMVSVEEAASVTSPGGIRCHGDLGRCCCGDGDERRQSGEWHFWAGAWPTAYSPVCPEGGRQRWSCAGSPHCCGYVRFTFKHPCIIVHARECVF